MPIGTVDRGEVSELEGEWVALIVPSFLVVQDATKGGAPDCDFQKEHADGNRKERKGLHECLQN